MRSHSTCGEEIRNAYRVLCGNVKEGEHIEICFKEAGWEGVYRINLAGGTDKR